MIWDLKFSKIHLVNIPWGTYRPCENTNSDVGTAEYSHLMAEGEHCLSQFHGWYRTNSQRRLERCRSYSDHDNILPPIVYSCFSPNNTVGARDRYIFSIFCSSVGNNLDANLLLLSREQKSVIIMNEVYHPSSSLFLCAYEILNNPYWSAAYQTQWLCMLYSR